jgi:hypothetical protein
MTRSLNLLLARGGRTWTMLAIVCVALAVTGFVPAWATTYFSQNFQSSTIVGDYDSFSPNSGQFNEILVSSGGTSPTIQTSNTNFLRLTRSSSEETWFTRSTDFASPAASAIMFKFDFGMSSIGGSGGVADLSVGSGFSTGDAVAPTANSYAKLGIVVKQLELAAAQHHRQQHRRRDVHDTPVDHVGDEQLGRHAQLSGSR